MTAAEGDHRRRRSLAPQVAMHNADLDAGGDQAFGERRRHCHAAMPAAGTADPEGQKSLALLGIARPDDRQQLVRVVGEFPRPPAG